MKLAARSGRPKLIRLCVSHHAAKLVFASTMRENLEFWLVLAVARTLGRMPRGLARLLAGGLAFAVYLVLRPPAPRGHAQPGAGPPGLSARREKNILRGVYRHLGWQLVEFCRMTRYTPKIPAAGCAPRVWTTTWRRRRAAKAC